jgi:hypothetical protein
VTGEVPVDARLRPELVIGKNFKCGKKVVEKIILFTAGNPKD